MKECFITKEFNLPGPISKIQAKEEVVVYSDDENEVNLRRCMKKKFYDQKICRHLCSKTLVLETKRRVPFSPCESICFELTRSFDSAGEVCPTQKYCPRGCPCPYYECEKFEKRQTMIPAFDLQKNSTDTKISDVKHSNKYVKMIVGRWEDKNKKIKYAIIFSNLKSDAEKISIDGSNSLFSYEGVQ